MYPIKVQLVPTESHSVSSSPYSASGAQGVNYRSACISSSMKGGFCGDGGEAGNLKEGSGRGVAAGVMDGMRTCISLSQYILRSGGDGRWLGSPSEAELCMGSSSSVGMSGSGSWKTMWSPVWSRLRRRSKATVQVLARQDHFDG